MPRRASPSPVIGTTTLDMALPTSMGPTSIESLARAISAKPARKKPARKTRRTFY